MDEDLRSQVRRRYAAAARAMATSGGPACCAGERPTPGNGACAPSGPGQPAGSCSCCGDGSSELLEPGLANKLYGATRLEGLPPAAVAASLGCGNPSALAEIIPGEVVLDLGSGGGLDVLISARRVGPRGKVYGLDMTDEMLALAQANQTKAGVNNVRFLKGDIEAIPLPDATVDVIISNCVINLAADKDQVLREAFRVLRPGGRLAVSDTVFQGDVSLLPANLRQDMDAWAACVAGSLEERDYLAKLEAAGFMDASLEPMAFYGAVTAEDGVRLVSGFVRARKPGVGSFGLREGRSGDLPAVARLLREAELPAEGVAQLAEASGEAAANSSVRGGLVVAEAGPGGAVIGAAGLEVYGPDGLLRSVVVDTAWQGRGLGRSLVQNRLDRGGELGLEAVYLLTSTAARYFTRLGFTPVDRAAAPGGLRSSVEFAMLCPSSSSLMRVELPPSGRGPG